MRINDAMNGGMGMVREGCRCREESGGRCGWGGGARTEVGDFFFNSHVRIQNNRVILHTPAQPQPALPQQRQKEEQKGIGRNGAFTPTAECRVSLPREARHHLAHILLPRRRLPRNYFAAIIIVIIIIDGRCHRRPGLLREAASYAPSPSSFRPPSFPVVVVVVVVVVVHRRIQLRREEAASLLDVVA